jgi:hypothetical protein
VPPGGAWTAASFVRQSSADLRLPARPASGARACQQAVGAGQGAARIPGRRAGAPGLRRGSRLRAFRARGVAGPAEAGAGRCRVRWAAGRQPGLPGAPMPMGVGGVRGRGPLPAPVRAVRACRAPGVCARACRTHPARARRGARLPAQPGAPAALKAFEREFVSCFYTGS